MRKLLLGLGVAVLSQFSGSAWAVTAVTSGVLEGDFGDVDYGAHSSTAPASTFISNGPNSSILEWGTGSVTYGTNYSAIEFIVRHRPARRHYSASFTWIYHIFEWNKRFRHYHIRSYASFFSRWCNVGI